MPSSYKIVVEKYNASTGETERLTVEDIEVNPVSNIFELGFRHDKQIEILQKLQDIFLSMQSEYLREDIEVCPKCGNKLSQQGYEESNFHSVFTDHKVKTKRQICNRCKWKSIPSIKSLFGTNMHPDLGKMQCEVGANNSYRESQEIMNRKSAKKRRINNHDRIKHVVESVGSAVEKSEVVQSVCVLPKAEELIAQVDGGHMRSNEPQKRSFEAMTAVVYSPYSVERNPKTNRGKIHNKSCAASALDDEQESIKKQILLAAQKQGLSSETNITALCDGAHNCWNVVDSLAPHCKEITGILDWFHIAKKFENLSLKEHDSRLKRIKWHLWRGNADLAVIRLEQLINDVTSTKEKNKLSKLITYIENNKCYIVNYRWRKKNNLVFTSNIAESNVESLINQRCKRKQHMIWSRLGAHFLLQIRAIIASNDWFPNWENFVLQGLTSQDCCQ